MPTLNPVTSLSFLQQWRKKLVGFKLSHPEEEVFPWPYFTSIVWVLAASCVAVLGLLNAALVGYETVTVFQVDFNVSQSFWYDRFVPRGYRSKPGTLCDPHSLNVGDTFTTSNSLFKWNLVTIADSQSGSPVASLVYNGSTLETCDGVALYVNSQIQSVFTDISIIIRCEDVSGFTILATSSFSITLLMGKYLPPLLGATPRFANSGNGIGAGGVKSSVLSRMIRLANADGVPLLDAFRRMPGPRPIVMSGNGVFSPCPASQGLDAPCAKSPPSFTIIGTTIVLSNGSHSTFDASDAGSTPLIPAGTDMHRVTLNIAQTVLAAVRIDLGNPSRNNIFLNPSALNQTLASTLNASLGTHSALYDVQVMTPLTVDGPANIQALYSCPKWQQRKAIRSAVVSVLVGMMTMFWSGWAVFMLVAGLCVPEAKGYKPVRP